MKDLRRQLLEIAEEATAFSVIVTSIVLLWKDNMLLLVVMLIITAIALSFWHDSYDLLFFLLIAVVGSIAEIVFVHFGVWQYANPTLLGIPIWFPPSFGTAGLITQRAARTINELSK